MNDNTNKTPGKGFGFVKKSNTVAPADTSKGPQVFGLANLKSAAAMKSVEIESRASILESNRLNTYESSDERINDLAASINSKLRKEGLSISVCQKKIERILSKTWWTSGNRQLHTMANEEHVLFTGDDRDIAFDDASGGIIDLELFEREAELASMTKDSKLDVAKKMRIMKIPNDMMLRYIKLNHQRNDLFMRVDMFADETTVRLTEGKATITYKHQEFPYDESKVIQEVVSDYKKHFPFLDELIKGIVSFRFASSRKHGYLWFHADSDFGKGFFENRLKDLGLVVDMNEDELKAVMSKKPCGKSAVSFRRAFILMFNEFKKINGSMKSIENSITINPKNQSEFEVEVYTKMFCSAEHVRSLVTEIGVDDQFSNRFNYHKSKGSIKPILKKYRDQGIEIDESITNYIANELNKHICEYQSLGRVAATNKANIDADVFYQRNKIEHSFDVISSNVAEIGNGFRSYMADVFTGRTMDKQAIKHLINENKDDRETLIISSIAKVYKAFVLEYYSGVEAQQLMFREREVRESIDSKALNKVIPWIKPVKGRYEIVPVGEFNLDASGRG